MKKLSKMSWVWLVAMLTPVASFADATAATTGTNWVASAAVCLGMALAVVAGATAQGKIGAAYMEGVSRNPSAKDGMFTPLVLALAFVEAMVLVTFIVVCFTGKF